MNQIPMEVASFDTKMNGCAYRLVVQRTEKPADHQQDLFGKQKNDFGWGHLPFSKLEENSVSMLLTAIVKNIYLDVLDKVTCTKEFKLDRTVHVKRFLFHFVIAPCKWVRGGRRRMLTLFSDRLYERSLLI